MSKTWFITGCSTGIGRLLSESLLDLGERVVVTARRPESIEDIGTSAEDNVLRLPLDVTNDLQIDEAVSQALAHFEEIDVLVNNAGYGYFSTQEEADLSEVRAMYDANVFGLISVSKKLIPHFRERKSGTIVNLSSMAGRMGTPRGGFYQSTKWAVEALSESQYLELSPFGVRVALIEPGAYATDFATRSARKSPAEGDPKSPYAELRSVWSENASRDLFPHRQDPREVVEAILLAVDGDVPFQRVPVGSDAIMIARERQERGMDGFVEWMRRSFMGARIDDD